MKSISSLTQQVDISSLSDLRENERRPWQSQQRVVINERVDGSATSREILVETVDLSRGGMSFISPSYLHVGTDVALTMNMGGSSSTLTGRVVHCAYHAGRHRVGVAFTQRNG